MICLLQCRPLQTFSKQTRLEIPKSDSEQKLFQGHNATMGIPQKKRIDQVIYIDPAAYYA